MAFLLSLRKAKMASVHPLPFRNPICALLNKDRMTTEWGRAVTWLKNSTSGPRFLRIPGFLVLVKFGILGFEILNTAQWNRKLTNQLESRNPIPGIRNLLRGFSYIRQMIIWKYNLKTFVRPSMCYWSDSQSLSFQWCRWSPLEYWTRALLNFLYTRPLEIRSKHGSLPWDRMKDSPQISARELAAIQSSRKKKKKRNWSRASSTLSPPA